MDVTAERILLRLKKKRKKCVNSIGVQKRLSVIRDGRTHTHACTHTHTHTHTCSCVECMKNEHSQER